MAVERTTCVVAGGGPAGLVLGLLLARAGIAVTVLEKHADFLRDFRGDTVHPSTLRVLDELGLLERFLALPHQETRELTVRIGGRERTLADFGRLRGVAPSLVLVPQWDLLDFVAREAARYPGFRLVRQAEVVDLVVDDDGVVRGVRATTPDGDLAVRADLVVAADGRTSVVRDRSGLPVDDLGAPIDVLWFRLSRRPGDREATGGVIEPGRFMVLINRGDTWQCAYVIAKDGFDRIRAAGLPAFRELVAGTTGLGNARVAEIASWDDVKLLRVQVNRLTRWWRPGLLCIGDAAHAMSPVGGVGINLAIQDAVATANLLARPLRTRTVSTRHLRAVQRRRTLPTRVTQAVQVAAQRRVIAPVIAAGAATGASAAPTSVPLPVRVLDRVPALRVLPALAVGYGLRPEHVRTT